MKANSTWFHILPCFIIKNNYSNGKTTLEETKWKSGNNSHWKSPQPKPTTKCVTGHYTQSAGAQLNTLTTKFTFTLSTLLLSSLPCPYWFFLSEGVSEVFIIFFPSNKVFQAIFLYLSPHFLHVNFLFCSFPINAEALPKLYFLHSSQIDLYYLPVFFPPPQKVLFHFNLCGKPPTDPSYLCLVLEKSCFQLSLAAILPQLNSLMLLQILTKVGFTKSSY